MIELDDIDRNILMLLIKDARMPYTDISKKINVSAGTVHGRVAKLEKRKIITGATLVVDYEAIGYSFTGYVGVILGRTMDSEEIIESLRKIPEVTVAHIASGQYSIFVKIRGRNTKHAREVIYKINRIKGVLRTETMISLEEAINDKERLFSNIFEKKG